MIAPYVRSKVRGARVEFLEKVLNEYSLSWFGLVLRMFTERLSRTLFRGTGID